jgi:hypothetical protein
MLSLLLEMDVMGEMIGGATARQMFYVAGEGFYHVVGGELVKYSDFFKKAASDTKDQGSALRFRAEGLGWERAERLFEDPRVEVVAVASPPGDTYKFEDMKPLSATFVLSRGGKTNLDIGGQKKSGCLVEAISIYVDEIVSQNHANILNQVAELTVRDLDPSDPLSVVAAPFVLEKTIHNFDVLANLLGFESWEQIESRVVDLQTLHQEGQQDRQERRNYIFNLLKNAIDGALTSNNKLEGELLAESIKQVLAKEAIGKYAGKNNEEIRQDIYLTIKSMQYDWGCVADLSKIVDPFVYSVWKSEQGELKHNAMFRRMMAAHGGGGLMTKAEAGIEMSLADKLSMEYLFKRDELRECKRCHGRLNSEGKCVKCSG